MSEEKRKLFIIDSYSLFFRAYHALPPLVSNTGLPVGASRGFTSILLRVMSMDPNAFYLAALDTCSQRNRNKIWPEYKSNRTEAPEDMKIQFPSIKKILNALKIESIEFEGFEADDVIASVVKHAKVENLAVRIVSSDKDLMQLIDCSVDMYDPFKRKIIDSAAVEEKFGVPPSKMLSFLSLAGDASDNIPGVLGIGVKTAALIMKDKKDLSDLFSDMSNLSNRHQKLLEDGRDSALISEKLVSLNSELPVSDQFAKAFRKEIPDIEEVIEVLSPFDVNAFSNSFEKVFGFSLERKNLNNDCSILLKRRDDIDGSSFNSFKEKGFISIFPVFLSCGKFFIFSCIRNEAFAIPYSEDENFLVPPNLRNILESPAVIKITTESKCLLKLCRFFSINVTSFLDIGLMRYAFSPTEKSSGISDIVGSLGELVNSIILGDFEDLSENDSKELEYAVLASVFAKEISEKNITRMQSERVMFPYYAIDMPVLSIIADMEQNGVCMSKSILQEYSKVFLSKAEKEEKIIYEIVGEEFNIASPKQLSSILYDKMGATPGDKLSRSGIYSTDAAELERLSQEGFEVASRILAWRKFTKLSACADGLIEKISSDGRLRTQYLVDGTVTGRLSSKNPNLQNIPIKDVDGREIRKAFKADKGYKLISVDYSQIELRVIAELSDEKNLLDIFVAGDDPHTRTAEKLFGSSDEESRRKGKTLNFSMLYGITPFGLARRLGCPPSDAKELIKEYWSRYPKISELLEKTKKLAIKNGFVRTFFGRKCPIPLSGDRAAIDRFAFNAISQGSAADIIKIAMRRIKDRFYEKNLNSRFIMQIHDELVFESVEEEEEEIYKILHKEMLYDLLLNVPLSIEIKQGPNWGDLEKINIVF